MQTTTKLGLSLLAAAALLGALADALLWQRPLGINVFLLSAAFVGVTATISRRAAIPLHGDGRWLAAPLLLFAAGFAWRDSPTLQFLDALAMIIALALAQRFARAGSLRTADLTAYITSGALFAVNTLFGPFVLLSEDIRWPEVPRGRWLAAVVAVGRGLIIAVPLLLLFGVLFVSADAVFARGIADLLDIGLTTLVRHLLFIFIWAWLAASSLRWTFLGKEPATVAVGQRPLPALSLGVVEVGTALGLVDLLFAAFVLVQVRYFFGGADLVQATIDLTYAEYARRGFFELVAVAALALPTVLAAHWLLRKDHPRHELWFRILAGVLVALVLVVLASAVQRMRLYQAEFGLTELRLYTTAFMAWLAVVLVWCALTVLRGRRERFTWGALVTAFVALAILNLINPDSFIIQVNGARWQAGQRFDADYASALSADATPDLVALLPSLAPDQRQELTDALRRRWQPPAQPSWLAWNWGRHRAWQAVADLPGLPTGGAPPGGGSPPS